MSTVSKPPRIPKPKSIAKNDDVATESHASLLTLTWSRLEDLLKSLYAPEPESLRNTIASEVAQFRKACERGQDAVLTMAKNPDPVSSTPLDNEAITALQELSKKLGKLAKSKIPPPTASLAYPVVSHPILQKALVKATGRVNAKREEIVGFVDIQCRLAQPSSIALSEPLGKQLDHLRDRFWHPVSKGGAAGAWLTLERIQNVAVGPPCWHVPDYHRTFVYLDVRTTIPPVGQFLRELKTLEDLLPADSSIIVVADVIPGDVAGLLRHEGFVVVSRKQLETVPAHPSEP